MKKTYKYIILSVALFCGMNSCNDSYLDRIPTHNLNDASYWKTVSDLRTYNVGIYNLFAKDNLWRGNGNGAFNSSGNSCYAYESQSDNFASKVTEQQGLVRNATGTQPIPAGSGSTGSDWNFDLLRRINVFFANYERVQADFEKVKPYLGEAHLFRAWLYFIKVQKYGDIPWVDRPLSVDVQEDLDILYGNRTPRKEVMDHVLADIKKAVEYLPASWNAATDPDRASKWVAYGLMSRVGLYEGTYRKYHGLGDEKAFLDAALEASEQIMNSGLFDIYNTGNPDKDYRSIFTQPELKSNKEVIFAKMYIRPGMGHRVSGYIVEQAAGPTKDFVEDFLIIENGKALPIELSTNYDDSEIEKVFENRDPRLRQTILHPDDATGILLNPSTAGYPALTGMTGKWQSPTGYHYIKNYEKEDDKRGQDNEINDFPVIRYAEILLNYAEAKLESTGSLSATDIDKTLNKLRARAGMPNFDPNPVMDPKYASEGLSALMVELRRERRVELSFEDFRYQDLMRWKKGSYLKKTVLGMRLEDADRVAGARYEKAKVTTVTVNGKKFVDVYAGTEFASDKRVFDEKKHYLQPIPLAALTNNPKLMQNPFWGD